MFLAVLPAPGALISTYLEKTKTDCKQIRTRGKQALEVFPLWVDHAAVVVAARLVYIKNSGKIRFKHLTFGDSFTSIYISPSAKTISHLKIARNCRKIQIKPAGLHLRRRHQDGSVLKGITRPGVSVESPEFECGGNVKHLQMRFS